MCAVSISAIASLCALAFARFDHPARLTVEKQTPCLRVTRDALQQREGVADAVGRVGGERWG
jgi:hypothetical protein